MKPTLAIVAFLTITTPLIAADGAIPVWEPTITEPGRYVLTRNITSSTGPVLYISSVGDVHLDLGGFTVEFTGSNSSAIRVWQAAT